jgi:FlaA1/EpsC-like NDP-sugar epimerase
MESDPLAAVRNNALGTWELARTAARFGAERLLMISTDKAVNPRSMLEKPPAEAGGVVTSGFS